MCRISGIISKGLLAQEAEKKIKVMNNALQHGGPDDGGIFVDAAQNLAFGHRRLSIIDLTDNGHQPMSDVGKKAWITFNGEIYNYLILKEELLKLGAKFHSNTDTEVIIIAYLFWGVAAFSKLRGMFAFALYDTTKGLTYLVRDSTGIKPLYYHIENGQLSFASEVKALKIAGITTIADEHWQVRFLALGHIPEPYTNLKNVYSLQKGHFLCWDNKNSKCTIEAYSQLLSENYIINEEEAKLKINEALKASINRQLMADAPIGVFLSGGVDSSLITLLANEQKQHQLNTVSIFFNEKAYDESAYQSIVSNKIEGHKFTHLVKQQDFEEAFQQILRSMDMPTTDGINTWFISKYAKEDGLKAVLSGLGADELYGGYPSFNRIALLKYLKKLPHALFPVISSLMPDHYKKINFLTNDHPLADYLLLRGLFSPADIAQILNMEVKQVNTILFSDTTMPAAVKYDKEYASWLEINLYMQNQLLRDTDVMSMSHGLEVRVPFLDEDFQTLTKSISPKIRFNKVQAKKLLADSFKDILPTAIGNRPKMGFTFPLQSWMRQYEPISNHNLYHNRSIKSVVNNFKKGKVHWSKAFALYQLKQHE
jgi:asparagine synthase (glutamine-hydrolysing)